MSALPTVSAFRILGPKIGPRPAWAKAVIIAEYREDHSDSMSDYWGSSVVLTVPLAWSKHRRDLFPEMRKAARAFKPTAHLGPDRSVFVVHVVGSAGRGFSFDHGEPVRFELARDAADFMKSQPKPRSITFDGITAEFKWCVREEPIEHREKWSMGGGYYLKAGDRHDTGWSVRKTWALDALKGDR